MTSRAAQRYLLVFVFAAILAIPPAAVLEAARRVGNCDPAHYRGDNFLGYCWDRFYGGYEKGAYYLPTEPQALAAVMKAKILFSGNSRAAYAFSNDVLDRFSERTGVPHYVFAFAGEGNRFFESLLDRHDLKPAVVVVNLDGADFFNQPQATLPDAARLMTRTVPAWIEFGIRKLGQSIQRWICTADRGRIGASVVCGSEDTVYRVSSNGHWQYAHRPNVGENFPISPEQAKLNYWPQKREQIIAEARRFADVLSRRNICVVLTNVPTERSSVRISAEVASAMGMDLLVPDLKGLRTFDRNHIGPESARRFTAALLELLGPTLERCVSRANAWRSGG